MYFLCHAGSIAQAAPSLPPLPLVQQGVLVLRASTVRKGLFSHCPARLARTRRHRTLLSASAVRQAGTVSLARFTCVP